MFIGKKDYLLWLENKNEPYLNKLMIHSFPFLMPHNRWSDKTPENYDYSYNEMNLMPENWARAFGYEMLCELVSELKEEEILDQYRIMDIKEKYGTLRWYDNCASEKVLKIVSKYCSMSADVCIYCGGKTRYETKGWVSFICKKCAREQIKKGWFTKKDLIKKEKNKDDDDE